jgi:hypothetical protein
LRCVDNDDGRLARPRALGDAALTGASTQSVPNRSITPAVSVTTHAHSYRTNVSGREDLRSGTATAAGLTVGDTRD